MSKATYWQRGETIDHKNDTDAIIEAGTVLELGEMAGVAGEDIAPGAVGGVHIEGVFRIEKKASEEIGVGVKVCLKDGAAQKDEGSEEDCIKLGRAVAPAAADDADVLVKINV